MDSSPPDPTAPADGTSGARVIQFLPGTAACVERDEGTLETLAEFFMETADGLGRADEILFRAEHGESSPEDINTLFRVFHTVKGTAGFLDLHDMVALAHATENLLGECRAAVLELNGDVLDLVFDATDGVRQLLAAVQGAVERREAPPEADLSALLEPIAEVLSYTGAGEAPAEAPVVRSRVRACPADGAAQVPSPPPASAPAAAPAQLRSPAVGLGQFCAQARKACDRCDALLLNVERDGADAATLGTLREQLEAIRRPAADLDLSDFVDVTEAGQLLLDRCRDGTVRLEAPAVDALFDAVADMRTAFFGLAALAEAGAAPPPLPGVAAAAEPLRAIAEGQAVREQPLPQVDPGQKLGEIITSPPLNVAPHVVEAAVASQQASGRRLGEELYAGGFVEARTVARALRAQARAISAERGEVRTRETVKVDLERLESLVEVIGELVVVEAMMRGVPEFEGEPSERARACLTQLAKVTRDLQDSGMGMRLVPVHGVFQKMARLVREISRKSGKQVRLVTQGEDTEVDRSMVERIADPLIHMIRNAVDHGIEPPEGRTAAGKPAGAVLRLSAFHEGATVVIELADDGRGLDREKIARKAIERGLIKTAQGLSDAEVYDLIFQPGFSTAEAVTELSGRGVGMDVVRRNVEALRGRVLIASTKGRGTTFKLVLPLTLAIIDGMLVSCGPERYVLPTLQVVESLRPEAEMVVTFAGQREVLNLRGEVLPLLRLDRLLALDGARADPAEGLVVVIDAAGHRIGLLVDEVLSQQQVVIKSLGEGAGDTGHFSGAAILGDGRVGLILAVDALVAKAYPPRRPGAPQPAAATT